MKNLKLMMLGPPGAGKGTQAQVLAKSLEIPQISTGDLLRASKQEGSALGKEAASYMDHGKLVPDELVINMVKERLQKKDAEKGYIFDGFPRTLAQAEALEDMGILLNHVISIEVSDAEIVRRLEGRRSCKECKAVYHLVFAPPKVEGKCDHCNAIGSLFQRADDQPEKIEQRLLEYSASTEPLIKFYADKGRLIQKDGEGAPKDVEKRIQKALGT